MGLFGLGMGGLSGDVMNTYRVVRREVNIK